MHVTMKIDLIIILLQVKDSGIGVDPEDIKVCLSNFQRKQLLSNLQLQHLFEGRQQTTQVLKEKGMGLVLVSQLAKLMGGELRVFSEYGVGSTFLVTLRFSKPPDPLPTPASSPALVVHPILLPTSLHVLVVETSKAVCDAVCAYMQDASPRLCVDAATGAHACVEFCGVTVGNTLEALHVLAIHKISIVIINDWLDQSFVEVNWGAELRRVMRN
jgi:Histidine kinase-, DNA gyrase B-, and HSP90-like ATPase